MTSLLYSLTLEASTSFTNTTALNNFKNYFTNT